MGNLLSVDFTKIKANRTIFIGCSIFVLLQKFEILIFMVGLKVSKPVESMEQVQSGVRLVFVVWEFFYFMLKGITTNFNFELLNLENLIKIKESVKILVLKHIL